MKADLGDSAKVGVRRSNNCNSLDALRAFAVHDCRSGGRPTESPHEITDPLSLFTGSERLYWPRILQTLCNEIVSQEFRVAPHAIRYGDRVNPRHAPLEDELAQRIYIFAPWNDLQEQRVSNSREQTKHRGRRKACRTMTKWGRRKAISPLDAEQPTEERDLAGTEKLKLCSVTYAVIARTAHPVLERLIAFEGSECRWGIGFRSHRAMRAWIDARGRRLLPRVGDSVRHDYDTLRVIRVVSVRGPRSVGTPRTDSWVKSG
jgi:hypothetical protein